MLSLALYLYLELGAVIQLVLDKNYDSQYQLEVRKTGRFSTTLSHKLSIISFCLSLSLSLSPALH